MADFDSLEAKLDSLTTQVGDGFASVRSDISDLNEKIIGVQDAIYELVRKTHAPEHSEELRNSLPDPPPRKAEFAR